MEDTNALKQRIKELMVENLMLQVGAAEIKDDQPLFGPGSLGLDSVDALQLVVALDKNFGLKIPSPAMAKEILQSVDTIAAAIQAKTAQASAA
jgi:acyl carrier protein